MATARRARGPHCVEPQLTWCRVELRFTAADRRLALQQLDLELELYLLCDQYAACFQRLVPGQAPLLAIDLATQAETELRVAPRILARADHFALKRERVLLALDLEQSVHRQARVLLRDARARELNRRVLLGIQEVS